MYGTSNVTALPVTGAGAAAMAGASGNTNLMAALLMLLAIWTLVAAVRTLQRVVPKTEV